MWVNDVVEFGIVGVFQGTEAWALAFNYFFTLTWVFGLVTVAAVLLIKVLTRS